jgi:hypothetical protein
MPEDFGRRFMVFVDTEEEFDWSKPHSREERSTTHVEALPVAQQRLASSGVKPIYLIDHPIASDPAAVDILRPLQAAGECGIGAHLHPWVNPPFIEEVSGPNSFSGNLPAAVEKAKLKCLTEAIAAAFGSRPLVYRAGRYGVGPNSAGILAELGYELDVSVRATFDYSSEKGPDFSGIKPLPYWIGDTDLLEVPLSAAYLGVFRGIGPGLFHAASKVPLLNGALSRSGFLNRVPITPEGVPLGEAIEAVDRLLDDGAQIISMSFHSPSVVPGHTPFVRDEADLATFYAWWDGMLDFLARRGVAPASLDDMLGVAERLRLAKAAHPPLSRRVPGQGL